MHKRVMVSRESQIRSRELAVMGLESCALSARVTKHCVTILVINVIIRVIPTQHVFFDLLSQGCLSLQQI